MKTFKHIACVLGLLIAGTASADDSQWGVGLKAGTLGLGAEARWSGLPYIDFRIGANAYSYETNRRHANVRYDTELDLETFYLTGNFHFPLTPFRLTAGIFSNGNEAILVGSEATGYSMGGQTWTPAEVGTLTGTTSFGSTSPYLGLGFDFEVFGKAGLNFDLGVLWQGEPDVSLVAVGGTQSGNPAFESAILAEQADLEDDLSSFRAYPVVSLSFVYNF